VFPFGRMQTLSIGLVKVCGVCLGCGERRETRKRGKFSASGNSDADDFSHARV
jgi:hypothetical protein